MQIFTEAALKILAMRQHYSAFCLASAKESYSKTASHQKSLFFRAVWCFFSEIILSYKYSKKCRNVRKNKIFWHIGFDSLRLKESFKKGQFENERKREEFFE